MAQLQSGIKQSSRQLINLDGAILEEEVVPFQRLSRAFKFGDGIFERVRWVDGLIVHAALHASRLAAGMRILQLGGDFKLTEHFIKEQCGLLFTALIDAGANVHPSQEFFRCAGFRISVFRKDAGDDGFPSGMSELSFLIELESIQDSAYSLNVKGSQIVLFTEIIVPRTSLSALNILSAIPFICASLYAKRAGVDVALLLNADGNLVASSTGGNIFLVKNNAFYTPSLAEGCVNSVMRAVVLGLLQADGFPVHELAIPATALDEADELFITDDIGGVFWVSGFKHHRYFQSASKRLITRLNQLITQKEPSIASSLAVRSQ